MVYLKLIILIYVLGVITAMCDFAHKIQRQGFQEPLIVVFVYLIFKKEHYKYTLKSWYYFLEQ